MCNITRFLCGALFSVVLVAGTLPAPVQAAGLTVEQASNLIRVVQAFPGLPASTFLPLITSFSTLNTDQATNLIKVIQAFPTLHANTFLPLIISFTDVSKPSSGRRSGGRSSGTSSLTTGQGPTITADTSDFDNNNVVDAADVDLLTQVILGDATCPTGKSCDINKDGTQNVADILALTALTGVRSPYDYNNDNQINADDSGILNSVINGDSACPSKKVCDLNGDGVVDVLDSIAFTNIRNGVPVVKVNAPTCTLTASSNNMGLSWLTTNATTFTIDQGVGQMETVQNGTVGVIPAVTTTYTGTAIGPGGSRSCSATVTVNTVITPPVIVTSPYDYVGGNGVVDQSDINFLTDVVAGNATCPASKDCDLDNDGAVIVADILRLLALVRYDYNKDNALNSADTAFLTNVVLGAVSCPAGKVCDVNGDKSVNVADVTSLTNKL